MGTKKEQGFNLPRIIIKELILNPVDFSNKDYQKYFYDLKTHEPKTYKELSFDNYIRERPFSKNLEEIFDDFMNRDFIDFDRNVILKSLTKIDQYLS